MSAVAVCFALALNCHILDEVHPAPGFYMYRNLTTGARPVECYVHPDNGGHRCFPISWEVYKRFKEQYGSIRTAKVIK